MDNKNTKPGSNESFSTPAPKASGATDWLSDKVLNAMLAAFQRGDSVERAHKSVMAILASPAATEATNQPLSEFERRCLHPTCTGSCEDCYYSQRITHRDDAALEIFVKACKAKMAKGRSKGRGGWEDPNQCPTGRLQGMLLDHLEKGDPLDVALFCMMLWMRGAPVVAVNFKAKLQAALEDAATICDNFAARDMHPAECASAIRMMKGSIK